MMWLKELNLGIVLFFRLLLIGTNLKNILIAIVSCKVLVHRAISINYIKVKQQLTHGIPFEYILSAFDIRSFDSKARSNWTILQIVLTRLKPKPMYQVQRWFTFLTVFVFLYILYEIAWRLLCTQNKDCTIKYGLTSFCS